MSSGSRIPEAARGSRRVRISRSAYARAEVLAVEHGVSVAQAVEAAIRQADARTLTKALPPSTLPLSPDPATGKRASSETPDDE